MLNLFRTFFLVAFLLYGTVIIAHQVLKRINRWMVALFGIGLVADFSATLVVCIVYGPSWQWNAHSISGLAALPIMASHFFWCRKARRGSDNAKKRFHRLSPFAGMFWVAVTVSGIPIGLRAKFLLAGLVISTSCTIGTVWHLWRLLKPTTRIKILKTAALVLLVFAVMGLDYKFFFDPACQLLLDANSRPLENGFWEMNLAFVLAYAPFAGIIHIVSSRLKKVWEKTERRID